MTTSYIDTRPEHLTSHRTSWFFTRWVDELFLVRDPAYNLGVWNRAVSPALESFVTAKLSLHAVKQQIVWRPGDDVSSLLPDALRTGEHLEFLRDVERLATVCQAISQTDQLTIKLETVRSNLCERFHVDQVPWRMVCTYAGPGTEWLDDADVDRSRLGPGSGGLPDELSGLLRSGAVIHHMERYAVGLMKGARWPGQPGRGLVHRSPPIRGTDLTRVLLKMEPASR
ncbi:MAG: DUF1826 domain-containing protein [Gemmataceae bacterium]|nr:DUF1826 domain-containing protein [Gemmataceae bacterium]MDW8263988.1 DUF1826 domain-containing protein [Gemmataceae bacterium]